MSNQGENSSHALSRRDLLRVALGATATGIPLRLGGSLASPAAADASAAVQPLEALTAVEREILEAMVARIIPTDANGPGAAEAHAARYIDRALRGALANLRQLYASGLASLDRYAHASRGAAFARLAPADQDAVLMTLADGGAAGFSEPTASAFFTMVRAHTLQGTFGDPFYGGNFNFIGWDLLGYPGLRLAVTADDQRLGAKLTPTHRSAYDHDMFVKAVAQNETIDIDRAQHSPGRADYGD
jgi:gluconate 2-dehydrogenase gamma chain